MIAVLMIVQIAFNVRVERIRAPDRLATLIARYANVSTGTDELGDNLRHPTIVCHLQRRLSVVILLVYRRACRKSTGGRANYASVA